MLRNAIEYNANCDVVAWRLPYGDSGVFQFFLYILSFDDLRQTLKVHSLRIVGNSCADTDENRVRLVESNQLTNVTRHVDNENLIPFTIPVTFNILVDHGEIVDLFFLTEREADKKFRTCTATGLSELPQPATH